MSSDRGPVLGHFSIATDVTWWRSERAAAAAARRRAGASPGTRATAGGGGDDATDAGRVQPAPDLRAAQGQRPTAQRQSRTSPRARKTVRPATVQTTGRIPVARGGREHNRTPTGNRQPQFNSIQ